MIWLLSCSATPDTATTPDTGTPTAAVTATLTLLDVASGAPLEGVSVSLDAESTITDSTGSAALSVPAGQPLTLLADSGDLPHRYHGMAGSEDLSIVGFLATQSITSQVYGVLGLSFDDAQGVVVAAMDLADLSPAYGASAALSTGTDGSFVFGPTLPESGDTLVDGGSSVVFFPNIPPGSATLTVAPPPGLACTLVDAGTDTVDVPVVAGEVTVAVFACQ
ncbi:MAG: hypothetical protein P8R54_11900 [Myxococcota bacterium]|nr:hypothetical protein [Myxococcota bacterium]